MAFCHDKDVRRELYMAYMTRGYPENEPVLRNLLRSRLKFAKLMGYDSWVDFATSDYMSGSDAVVRDFIDRIAAISSARGLADNELLIETANTIEPGRGVVEPFEINYLNEVVKKEKYSFDVQTLRPYFDLMTVLQGALDFYGEMFDVTFVPLPKPDPVVTIKDQWLSLIHRYEVHDRKTSKLMAYANFDLHPRDGKYGHAAVFPWKTAVSNPDGIASFVC